MKPPIVIRITARVSLGYSYSKGFVTNKGGASFTIVGGADKNRFSLNGDELTFKATFFNSRRDNPAYRVKIKATRMDSNSRLLETEKILVVTVLEGLYIITTDVSAPENRNKVITLAVNKEIPRVFSIKLDFEIVRGLDANKFTLVDNKLTFEAPAFNDRTDATYRVKIKATFAENSGAFPKTETAEKTLTVTIINPISKSSLIEVTPGISLLTASVITLFLFSGAETSVVIIYKPLNR
jgi:hypothetical protein